MKILCIEPVSTNTRLCSLSVFDSNYNFLFHQVISADSPDMETYFTGYKYVCFDALRIMEIFGSDKFSFMLDAKVLFALVDHKSDDLMNLSRDVFGENYSQKYDEISEKMNAHLNSFRVAKIKVDRYDDTQLYPDYLLRSMYIERAKATVDLVQEIEKDNQVLEFYSDSMYKNIKVLSRIANQPIKIDADAIKDEDAYQLRTIKKNVVDGMAHLKFNAVGARTGRLSFKKGTINIYALPREMRSCIVARGGYSIAQFDFRSFQPRLAIFSNRDEAFKDRFKDIDDIYSVFPGEREENKISFLAWMFSNSRNEMFEKEAFAIYNFRNELYREAKRNGRVTNTFGRVIGHGDKEKNVVFQNYITSLEVDAILELMRWIDHILEKKKSRIMFPFHDAIVMEIHDSEAEIIPLLKKFMENYYSKKLSSVFPVEVKIGKDFGNLKDEVFDD